MSLPLECICGRTVEYKIDGVVCNINCECGEGYSFYHNAYDSLAQLEQSFEFAKKGKIDDARKYANLKFLISDAVESQKNCPGHEFDLKFDNNMAFKFCKMCGVTFTHYNGMWELVRHE